MLEVIVICKSLFLPYLLHNTLHERSFNLLIRFQRIFIRKASFIRRGLLKPKRTSILGKKTSIPINQTSFTNLFCIPPDKISLNFFHFTTKSFRKFNILRMIIRNRTKDKLWKSNYLRKTQTLLLSYL